MKKWLIGLASFVLVIGIGTSVYAATDADSTEWIDRMQPIMKQMHPSLTDQQVQDMANACQSGKGLGMRQMMNDSGFRDRMMNVE